MMGNVLIACEESQVVCKAFRELGHNAFSCDVLECSGGMPEFHILGDCLTVLNPRFNESDLTYNIRFMTQSGKCYQVPKWDLIIAHPPCTYLTVTGNSWFNVSRYGDKALQRAVKRDDAIRLFLTIADSRCEHIALENPVGVISTAWRKPDQIIHPYMFGDPFEKKTCLWLKGLKPLVPVNPVLPPERLRFESGKTMPKWYADLWRLPKEERSRLRSRTFPGFASAMASQWGCLI